ncbi:DUF6265 family protein [Sphingomonas sp. DBB INV C78]|uniref:DUF6265 family protein n=1 Tax=Sphingomonas sp. DBB INV C78 TaxID=3349434 RepID=UPI0036D2F640
MRMIAIMAALGLFAASPAAAQDAASLTWMAGGWVTEADGRWTEEWWTPPRGGIMIGAGLTGKGDKADFFEHMRIMPDKGGTLAFFGMPRGAPAVAFRLVRSGPTEAVFENSAHDFPQRVHYRLEREMLVATVSTIDGAKAETWRYKRR